LPLLLCSRDKDQPCGCAHRKALAKAGRLTVQVAAAGVQEECPLCVKGSGKPVGHRGVHRKRLGRAAAGGNGAEGPGPAAGMDSPGIPPGESGARRGGADDDGGAEDNSTGWGRCGGGEPAVAELEAPYRRVLDAARLIAVPEPVLQAARERVAGSGLAAPRAPTAAPKPPPSRKLQAHLDRIRPKAIAEQKRAAAAARAARAEAAQADDAPADE